MKKPLLLIVIAFVLFYVFTQPANAADVVKSAGGAIEDAFNVVIEFLSALFA